MKKSAPGSNSKAAPSKKKQSPNSPIGSNLGQPTTSLQGISTKNPREAAFLAIFSAEKQLCYIQEWLELWRQQTNPSAEDFRLAQEIAFGAMRMKLTLDFYARQLCLKIKPKPLTLLRTAIYQYKMMDKVPSYAIVNETVKIAKNHFSTPEANFLNAILRKIETTLFTPPQDLSTLYSYPPYLIDLLLHQYGKKTTEEILQLGNTPPTLSARKRNSFEFTPVTDLHSFATSSNYYIQNSTQPLLYQHLKQHSTLQPQTILDLCAAPGGKLLLAHEFFPNATLFANDVSDKKLAKLKDNLRKYQFEAKLTCGTGEAYPSNTKFDLILLDVPCSNTGVLNKRPEARWRITQASLEALQTQSKKLLTHALTLLKPGGRIWFSTCSILNEENELLLKEMNLTIGSSKLILPDANGADGGFAAELC